MGIKMKSQNTFQSIPPDLEKEVTKAISQWVASLSAEEAGAKSIFFDGTGYSPQQIKSEVERRTKFGMNFISGLCSLNAQMITENSSASIIELIRESTRQPTR
jgi:hypothetical protein